MRELKRPVYMYRFDLVKLIENTLSKGFNLESLLRGNSMEPTAFDGDRILIRPISSYSELRVGMIAAMLSADNRHFVLHRIQNIDLENKLIYEKGDNCTNGTFVNMETIKGIVCYINDKEV